MPQVNHDQARQRLMRLLAVEGITGQEKAIGRELIDILRAAGVPARNIRFDDAHKRISLPTETGNLLVNLPGRGELKAAPRILFSTHMDTVPLCAGAKPKIQGRKIINAAKTALGGDNRTGCGVLATLAAELVAHKQAHPPVTLLFTVREESGLWGARFLNKSDLGETRLAFNFDGRSASDIIIGAVGADRWEVEIFGRASHAGGAPEKGISANLIFARALSSLHAKGWFGKISRAGRMGTSNVGSVGGADGSSAGDATNVVTDYVHVTGESRSHDAKFVKEITTAYKTALRAAAERLENSEGKCGKVKFKSRLDYHPFALKTSQKVVKQAQQAISAIGLEPEIKIANGGLDANWLVRHGIPTVTFGAGQNDVHTISEWIDLTNYERACSLAVQLATAGSS
ncbi:MAG: M20/M25/M40 family metallo-hydrolase [Hyphomicrobiaceae bacterium]